MPLDDRRETHANASGSDPGVIEEVEVRGHIVDSLLLPKILDRILQMGGTFEIRECVIGSRRVDPSHARIAIRAADAASLDEILGDLVEHGASPVHPEDAKVELADIPGAFPDGFYSTTNQRTQLRLGGRWVDVLDQEMDCGIVVDPTSKVARCVPMIDVEPGMPIVVGHGGLRVIPTERPREASLFGFMSSGVSSEKPKAVSLQAVADSIRATRAAGKKVLLVGGPAIVHTGSAPHVAQLIREGWVQTLFAGNALATHDIEQAIYGTSLGVSIDQGEVDRARPRAPPPDDQHHPPPGRDQGRRRVGPDQVRDHVRVHQARRRRRPRRLGPRRRPVARGHHRRRQGPGDDAGARSKGSASP